MKAKRLSAQRAVKLLAEFYESGTPEEMEHSFNWSHAPEVLNRSERVYAYYDMISGESFADSGVQLVGFGILEMNTHDARDTEAFLSCGVFKEYRRKGYWHKIMADLIEKSKELGADYCSRIVNKVNEEHFARSIREALGDSGWVHAGDHWYPAPGHGYFVWLFDSEERDAVKSKSKEINGGKA